MSRLPAAVTVLALVTAAGCMDSPSDLPGSEGLRPRFAGAAAASAAEQVMPGEVIVATVPGVAVAEVASAHGLAVAERGYGGRFYVVRGAVGSEQANAQALGRDARVRYAEPNYLRQTTTIKPELWAFYNPGGLSMKYTRGRSAGLPIGSSYASVADADEDNAPEDYAADARNDVVIGSIDTGVEFTHPELSGRLIAGHDWYSNDDDPSDTDGHGTHTTGTMAGSTVGVAGVAGAAAHVKVYVQRVCGKRGCPSSAVASAIRAAADQADMVAMNLSLGGSSESTAEAQAIAYAVDTMHVLVVASAGNNAASTIDYPAADPRAISVAATTWQDKLAGYSNYGTGLDIAAPGGYCYSNTTPEGCIYSAYRGGTYAWLQGTSMAAPQVTGTAAVVAAANGNLRGSTLRTRILSSVDYPGTDSKYGSAGRLNTFRAVTNKNP